MRYPLKARRDGRVRQPERASDSGDWASGIAGFLQSDAELLCLVVRTLYPHDWLNDAVYRTAVLEIARAAMCDKEVAMELAGFLRQLAGAHFDHLTEGERVAVLKAGEASSTFRYLQASSLRLLYSDPAVWEGCGYEGVEGCSETDIRVGINDLDWLPEPALESSTGAAQ